MSVVTLDDLAETIDPASLPPLDRLDADGWHLAAPYDEWVRDGVMHLRGFIPHDVIDAYCTRFVEDASIRAVRKANDGPVLYPAEVANGYGIGTPYLQVPEIRDLCLHRALTPILDGIHGEPMGVHLNLTGWTSTLRNWHQDDYLNPPHVRAHYAAVWFALDDIAEDAGPFEYVPGSHRWPLVARARMLAAMGEDGSDPDWPWRSEKLLGPLFDKEIVNRGGHVERFIARKGDVLIWHGRTVHRGSRPERAGAERRALIAHYSVVSKRIDMPQVARWTTDAADGTYFVLGAVA